MLAAGRKNWKTPNLTEAANILLDIDHTGAHRAMADVKVTIALFRLLVDEHGAEPKPDAKAPKKAKKAKIDNGGRASSRAPADTPPSGAGSSDPAAPTSSDDELSPI